MTTIALGGQSIDIDLTAPISLAITLSADGVRAWYVDKMRIAPVLLPAVTGSVKLGGNVNFNAIEFNPHGHGTHTETVGHITPEDHPISALKLPFFMTSSVISIAPDLVKVEGTWQKLGDRCITADQIRATLGDQRPQALIVRTLPNELTKRSANYSGTNFSYFEPAALAWLAEIGVEHVLVDLPSVDREEDGGLLLAHRAFWQYPHATRAESTITELIFVPNGVKDGSYVLHLDWAPFENDAAPSNPTLFEIQQDPKA